MANPDVNVNRDNSPYEIAGPTANFNTVTIETGGWLACETPTTITIVTLNLK